MTSKKVRSLARAVDIAADLATTRPPGHVPISEIAALARCSTATLYACFASKDELLSKAFEHGRAVWSAPVLQNPPGPDALASLIAYYRERIAYLASSRLRGLMGILVSQSGTGAPTSRHDFADLDELPHVAEHVARAMADGAIWPGDADGVSYALQTATSYEPLMLGLLLGKAVEPDALLRTVFPPHLTPKGMTALDLLLEPISRQPAVGALLGRHATPSVPGPRDVAATDYPGIA